MVALHLWLICQAENHNGSTPFSQYYKSIMSKAASRKTISNGKSSGKKGRKKMQHRNGMVGVTATEILKN
ncbi:hypothetical protein RIF29_25233 [Crotalaria pallida]|uniref:Uncharacterized protein n=1 Tax=Crotalaria pallida TaxID=3830 RepID=A0AAN9ETE6_CROPI